MDEGLAVAVGLFEEVIAWLEDHYSEFEFWVERDLVWTVQSHLGQALCDQRAGASVQRDQRLSDASRHRPGSQRRPGDPEC